VAVYPGKRPEQRPDSVLHNYPADIIPPAKPEKLEKGRAVLKHSFQHGSSLFHHCLNRFNGYHLQV
jgi:hypothetical protein